MANKEVNADAERLVEFFAETGKAAQGNGSRTYAGK